MGRRHATGRVANWFAMKSTTKPTEERVRWTRPLVFKNSELIFAFLCLKINAFSSMINQGQEMRIEIFFALTQSLRKNIKSWRLSTAPLPIKFLSYSLFIMYLRVNILMDWASIIPCLVKIYSTINIWLNVFGYSIIFQIL